MRRGQFFVQRGHSFGEGRLSTRSLSSEATFPGGVGWHSTRSIEFSKGRTTSWPRYPHPRTPQLQLFHTGTPAAPKRVKLSSLEATSRVVKRLDFFLHESPLRATSAEGHHLLTALSLTLLSDGGVSTSSSSDSDTDTWNTSGGASSQPSVRSCSTEASR